MTPTKSRSKSRAKPAAAPEPDATAMVDEDSDLSDDELEARIKDYAAQLQRRRMKAFNEAVQRLREIAQRLGISNQEIRQRFPVRSDDSSPARRSRRAAEFENPGYLVRNPSNPAQTWRGRGRQPAWFIEARRSGRTPEEMRGKE